MPRGSLGVPSGSFWNSLALPLDALGLRGVPLGCPWTPWGPHDLPWGSLRGPWGLPWGSLGGALGCLGVPKANFSDLSKIGCPIPSKCVYLHAPTHRIWPPGILSRIPRIHSIHRKWHMARSSRPPFLAPGARMTQVRRKLPQIIGNKQFNRQFNTIWPFQKNNVFRHFTIVLNKLPQPK